MSDLREIELAIEHFASNQEFIRLYNRHNRELLLQHFLLIAAAGDEVWRMNQERKMSMSEQRDQMLIKYMEWLERMSSEFPEVQRPADVNEDWWRLMLLAYERKPISGKSLWRKFKEDTRNPILSSFNCHWAEPREHETLEDRFRHVRRGVWRDLGHRDDEFLPEGTWLPKQWYAWRYCCYPGKNFRAFDGKLPSVGLSAAGRHRVNASSSSGRLVSGNEAAVSWAAAIPIDIQQMHDAAAHSSMLMNGSQQGHRAHTSTTNSTSGTVRINRSTLPTTVANQRLLAAAASMARVRVTPDDELSVQQYLADVQQYTAQMTRLEKAVALAESFGDHEKAIGFKRQLYEHVQSEPPQRLKRAVPDVGSQGLSLTTSSYDHSASSSGNTMSNDQNGLLLGMPDGVHHHGGMHPDHAAAYATMPALSAADGMDGNGSVSTSSSSSNSVQGMQ
jgi:hypothetical protein